MSDIAMALDFSSPRAPDPFALEARFDGKTVAVLALREKQIQQSYRPIIGIHKWFARRPGSVFRSLLLTEFVDLPLEQSYWQSNSISGTIADPFMGGGTTVYESLRLGLSVIGCDINPMSYWLVRQAVESCNLEQLRYYGNKIWTNLNEAVGDLYITSCLICRNPATVKYFLWAKEAVCPRCGDDVPLLPGFQLAAAVRHPRRVFYCPDCKELTEVSKDGEPNCRLCSIPLGGSSVRRGTATCRNCQEAFAFSEQMSAPPTHRLLAMEYYCESCYPHNEGRQFKAPEPLDHLRIQTASEKLASSTFTDLIPPETIPPGDETSRLHRWGYYQYRQLFNDRQLLSLITLMDQIEQIKDQRIRFGLATVFSDVLRYQNLLCRYDTYALKCQDIFSIHGYPVGLTVCENNVAGIHRIGSGAFIHFVEKFARAKQYAQQPYEKRHYNGRTSTIYLAGESIEAPIISSFPDSDIQEVALFCAPSQNIALLPESLDGVFTDPPYFDNVQYAELMDFCFVWLRRLLRTTIPEFSQKSTRTLKELTGNSTDGRSRLDFTDGLSQIFRGAAVALRPGAPLVLTYHHNNVQAYAPLVVALLDAGLYCTRVLPVPAEMIASIHITGTKSSIIDSVFVCRSSNWIESQLASPPQIIDSISQRVADDVAVLAEANYTCNEGDILCLQAGHVAGESIRRLSSNWISRLKLDERLAAVDKSMGVIAQEMLADAP